MPNRLTHMSVKSSTVPDMGAVSGISARNAGAVYLSHPPQSCSSSPIVPRPRRPQRLQLPPHCRKSGVEPRHFLANLIAWHYVMRHFQRGVGGEMRVTDGDATGDASTVQDKTHSPSPKQLPIRVTSASIASASSAPVVSMLMLEPLLAASVITPMMLFALTLRPLLPLLLLRDSHTSL